MDYNYDGALSIPEVSKWLNISGINLCQANSASIFDTLDPNSDGIITIEESYYVDRVKLLDAIFDVVYEDAMASPETWLKTYTKSEKHFSLDTDGDGIL